MSENKNSGQVEADDNQERSDFIDVHRSHHQGNGLMDNSSHHDDSTHNDDDSSSAEDDDYDDDKHDRSTSHDAIIPHTDQDFEGLDTKQVQEAPEFALPSSELIEKIVQQVEYYFSDENIVKDEYLVKHIKRNKQGYVSLKVISSFHKMKKLTNDYRVVAYALEHASKKLEISENKNKVKRLDAIPKLTDKLSADECPRSVIAIPVSTTSVEELKKQFEKCGNVLKVCVFTDDLLPPWLKNVLDRKYRVLQTPFAVVEYDSVESATLASKTLTNTSDWRRGMKVDVLAKARNKTENKEKENKQNTPQDSTKGDPQKSKKKKKKPKKKDVTGNRIAELQAGISSSGSDLDKNVSPLDPPHENDRGIPIPSSPKPNINYSKSFGCSPTKTHPHAHHQNPNHLTSHLPTGRHGGLGKSPLVFEVDDGTRIRSNSFGPLSSSPGRWLQKKIQESGSASASVTTVSGTGGGGGSGSGGGCGGGSDRNISTAKEEQKSDVVHKRITEGFTRVPKGPDGSKGFHMKRILPPQH